MKIYKISQNLDYLKSIGVPEINRQEILDHLLALDKDSRKIILRKIKKNPKLPFDQIKELGIENKKDYLRKLGYPEEVIDYAISISSKHAVWLTREIMNYYQKHFGGFIREKPPNPSIIVLDFKHNFGDQFLRQVLDWANATNPNLMQYNLEKATEESQEWHEQLKEQESISEYKSHNVWYKFPDGWEIVQLKGGDCEAEGELMGHCVGSYIRQVEEGTTNIFSLRDPKNKPHVTIEAHLYYKDPKQKNPKDMGVEIVQIQGKENAEPIPEYKTRIKEWFDHLKTSRYEFDPVEYDEKVTVRDLNNYDMMDEYGLTRNIYGIGGDEETYFQNLQDCYHEGVSGSYWHEGTSAKCADNLINYAYQHDELDKLQNAMNGFQTTTYDQQKKQRVKKWSGFNELVNEWWFDAETYLPLQNERPEEIDKEDFMIHPDPNQLILKEIEPPQPILDEKAYNKALKEYEEKEKAYEEEYSQAQNNFEPIIFQNYVYDELQKAKQRKDEEKKGINTEKAAYMNTKIYKMAVNEKDIPSADILATYIESLKLFLKDNPSLNKKLAHAIKNLPSPRIVKRDYSESECNILYETIGWVWRKITGQDIIKELKIQKAPESLMGNYWLMKNGVLLHGLNHFTIAKQNASLISSLLNLNGFTFQEYLGSNPNKLIQYIIKNGGARLFINKNKKMFVQMSSETYGKWGKHKIKKYDFNKKIVKIIDFKAPYNGWKSGITVRLSTTPSLKA